MRVRNISSAVPASFMVTCTSGAELRIKRGVSQFFRVHFAKAFEAGDGQAAFAGGTDGRGEASQIFQRRAVLAADQVEGGVLSAGPDGGSEGIDGEAELFQLFQATVDAADFVEFDNVELRRGMTVALGGAVGIRRSVFRHVVMHIDI